MVWKATKHTNIVFLNMLKKPGNFFTYKQKALVSWGTWSVGNITPKHLLKPWETWAAGWEVTRDSVFHTQNLESCLESHTFRMKQSAYLLVTTHCNLACSYFSSTEEWKQSNHVSLTCAPLHQRNHSLLSLNSPLTRPEDQKLVSIGFQVLW